VTRLRAALILGGIVGVAGVAVAAIGGLVVDRVDEGVDDATGDEVLAGELRQAVREAHQHPVDLTDVVDGDWERLVVACPYESGSETDRNLGFEWEGYGPGNDSTANVLFADDTEVLIWAETSAGAFCRGPAVVDREDAVLDLTAPGGAEVQAGG
jgi:hypothetical protein